VTKDHTPTGILLFARDCKPLKPCLHTLLVNRALVVYSL